MTRAFGEPILLEIRLVSDVSDPTIVFFYIFIIQTLDSELTGYFGETGSDSHEQGIVIVSLNINNPRLSLLSLFYPQ